MVRFPLCKLEGVDAFACSEVAAIVAAGKACSSYNASAADQKPAARLERYWRSG
jgi:hypothetical protein